jgi:hypothetical protein
MFPYAGVDKVLCGEVSKGMCRDAHTLNPWIKTRRSVFFILVSREVMNHCGTGVGHNWRKEVVIAK